MFLVSECPNHGTKVTTDNASARVYRDLARACVEDGANDPNGHFMWHRVHNSDCWTCCDNMRIAGDWEQSN